MVEERVVSSTKLEPEVLYRRVRRMLHRDRKERKLDPNAVRAVREIPIPPESEEERTPKQKLFGIG